MFLGCLVTLGNVFYVRELSFRYVCLSNRVMVSRYLAAFSNSKFLAAGSIFVGMFFVEQQQPAEYKNDGYNTHVCVGEEPGECPEYPKEYSVMEHYLAEGGLNAL